MFVIGAKRTAFGKFGGILKDKTATDLAEIAARAALQEAAIKPENVDHVVFGNTIQSSRDASYLARHVALRIGLPHSIPAVTINRLCGSGFQSIIDACLQIKCGDSKIVLTGGTESMSQAPFIVRNVRFGTTFGADYMFEDSLWQGLTDEFIKMPMAITAENLGVLYKLTRNDVDEFANRSQTRWRLANNAEYFKAEITPIIFKAKEGDFVFDVDEHPRETTIESLAKLKSIFKKDGLVTAGNASGICDGASSVIVANEGSISALHLTPLARIVAWDVIGCDPSIMGIGPVYAIRNILKKTGLGLANIDLIEVPFSLCVFDPYFICRFSCELGIENDQLNVNGGAIALGHPLAASGSRIIAHLCHELNRRNAKYAVGAACIGGGQGIAILLEHI
ncbi:unnamed protein product [Dracunculus medinensis]|uniref:Thiolase_N domain-containing protein n=1 Tax=Dracunculus medinensis TaxID=318479 RepID=A0A3P7QNU7_DRAME|nr:unnamed protein product [Dracunculus medinensis]